MRDIYIADIHFRRLDFKTQDLKVYRMCMIHISSDYNYDNILLSLLLEELTYIYLLYHKDT